MTDATYCKSHQHAAGAKGGNEEIGLTKGGRNTKIHAVVDSFGFPIRLIVTSGTVADCSKAIELLEGIDASCVFADKAYDTQEILNYAKEHNMQVVIPPKKNRIEQREYDKHLYKYRHLVENFFFVY